MITATAVLFALHTLPVCWRDRRWDGKETQLAQIAQVIADVSAPARKPLRLAAELVTLGWYESKFCRYVQLRTTGPGHGFWQLEIYVGWVDGDEDQSVRMGAINAARALNRGIHCGASPYDRFTAYAGRPCGLWWPTVIEREDTYYRIRKLIHDEASRETARVN